MRTDDPDGAASRGVGLAMKALACFVLLGGLAGGFVFLRNTQVQLGRQAGELERRIERLEGAIESAEVRLERAKSRAALVRRLEAMGSDLEPIPPESVVPMAGWGGEEETP